MLRVSGILQNFLGGLGFDNAVCSEKALSGCLPIIRDLGWSFAI